MTKQFKEETILQQAKELIMELTEAIEFVRRNSYIPTGRRIYDKEENVLFTNGKKMGSFIKRFIAQDIKLLNLLNEDPYSLPLDLANPIHQLSDQLAYEIKKINSSKTSLLKQKMKNKIQYLLTLAEEYTDDLFASSSLLKTISFPDGMNAFYFLSSLQKGRYDEIIDHDQELQMLKRYLHFFCQYQKVVKRMPINEKRKVELWPKVDLSAPDRIDSLFELAEHALKNREIKSMQTYQWILDKFIKESYLNREMVFPNQKKI